MTTVESYRCTFCDNGKFIIMKIDNALFIVCSHCGFAHDFEADRQQLLAARKELGA